ncbi:hypothetical protein Ancab_038042 [Ancistrocladus abbreviatus]
MTTAISIEDVRREVKMLKALSGHKHLVKLYDACEDTNNVYIVMEIMITFVIAAESRILPYFLALGHANLLAVYDQFGIYHDCSFTGGRSTEEDAQAIVVQILTVVAFCHLQSVVHWDLKPEALLGNATDAMKESRIPDILNVMAPLSYRKMDFEEFCAACIITHQLEALQGWEQIASTAFGRDLALYSLPFTGSWLRSSSKTDGCKDVDVHHILTGLNIPVPTLRVKTTVLCSTVGNKRLQVVDGDS